MRPSQLTRYLEFELKNRFNVLIVGAPGIGKSDIVADAAKNIEAELIVDHPVISDPTDYKGLPYAVSAEEATFIAYKNLKRAITATSPLIYFLDDLGQAPSSVQAAVMQLLRARQIGEHKVSEHVTFVSATNRKEDKAAVVGMLAPVKTRMDGGIIHLEVDANDWCKWALEKGNMPLELIAFIRFRPDIINNLEPPSKDLTNTACPRTIESVGRQQNAGLPTEFEAESFAGIAGLAFATEYRTFLEQIRHLPSLDEIIMNPLGAKVPELAGQLFALCAGLASRSNEVNFEAITTYLDRLPAEFAVCCVKDSITRKSELCNTTTYTKWSVKNQELLGI